MKHKAVLLLLVVAVAAGAAYWNGKPASEKAQAKKAAPPVPVTVAQAGSRDLPVTLDVVGRGEAYATVTLKSRIDGQVLEVPFVEGKSVVAGALLIRLDPADFLARVKQAEAALARDQAFLNKTRADVARYQVLYAQQFVSQEKVGEMRTNEEAAAATVHADQATLELARLQLSYTRISAPFAGVAGAKLVYPGAAVKVNDTALAVLNRVQPLYVSFAMPEKHLPAIRAAQARGVLTVAVNVPGDKRPPVDGKVVFLDNAVDPATGTLRMKAELANADGKLAPGQFLSVNLRLDTLRDAVVVPAEAVQQGPEGSFVYVLSPEGGAKMRKVEIAQVRDAQAAIAKGLTSGETVLTDGFSRLTPGAKVKVKGAAKPEPHMQR
jgi:membrane fusion protein, multidrug efflux system